MGVLLAHWETSFLTSKAAHENGLEKDLEIPGRRKISEHAEATYAEEELIPEVGLHRANLNWTEVVNDLYSDSK